MFLNSRLFQDYLIRTLVGTISNVTGTRAEIGKLDFQPARLTVHIYDLTLHGSGESSQPALLHVDKLAAHIGFRNLLGRQIILDDVSIDHPIVHMLADDRGIRNFPLNAGSGTDGGSRFSLAISHLLLTRGELTYRDERIPLDADLHDLAVELNGDPQSGRSRNSISYRDGLIRLPSYPPAHHSLTAKFVTSKSHISVEEARLVISSSVVSISGEVDLSRREIVANYDVRMHPGDLENLWAIRPTGTVTLNGRIHYVSPSLRQAIFGLSGNGKMSSDLVEVPTSLGTLRFEKVQAPYEFADNALRMSDIKAQLFEGRVGANLKVDHLDNSPAFNLSLSLDGLSLQAIHQAVRNKPVAGVALRGMLNGKIDTNWTGGLKNLVTHCNLKFISPISRRELESTIVLPVAGDIDFTYDHDRAVLKVQPTTLHLGSTNLALQGEVGHQSHLNVEATVDDLHQFAALIASLNSNKTAPALSGSLQLKAQMQGSPQSPHFLGYLSGKDVAIKDSRWSLVSTSFELSPSRLLLQHTSLVNAHEGTVRMNGTVELHQWSYATSNLTQISVSVHALPISELQNIAGWRYAEKGEVSGEISLRGAASDLTGSGTINIINAEAYEEPLQKVTAQFSADHGSVKSAVDIRSPAGSATANLSYVFPADTYEFRLDASGIALQELRIVRRRNLPLRGVVTISASGEGSLASPKLAAEFEINEAEFRGSAISQIRGKADLVGHNFEVECRSQIAGGSVQMRGHANLADDYYTETTIDSDTLQFEQLQNIYLSGSSERLQGQTEFHLLIKGPLRRPSQLEGQVNIPILSVGYESLRVSAVKPIRLDVARSLITLEPAEFQGSGTSFQMQGSVPLQSPSRLNVRATGSIDAGLLRMLAPDVKSSGSLSFDVHTIESRNNPSLEGQVLLKDVALTTPTAPVAIDSVNGTLNIGDGKLRIVNLTGRSADGELSMAGTIVYQPHLQFDVTLKTKALRMRYAGLKVSVDTELAFVGQANAPTIRGKASVNELSLAPDLDLSKLGEGFTRHNVPRQRGVSDSIKLAVLIQSNNRLKASNSQLSVEGNLNLQVVGTAADPVIIGRMDLTSAEFLYRARRYQLQRGFIVFDNPHQTRPTLDVSVTTTVQQYNLTLAARGPIEKLTTSYVSDPPLPTADIISLVAFGSTTHSTDAAGHGADSILASQVGGQLSNKMQGLTGISSLRIDPLVGGSNRNPSARIAIQQRVTKNFLFTFSTDVSQPGSETVEGKYQFNKRWSVGVARDPVGGISLDGRYHTRF